VFFPIIWILVTACNDLRRKWSPFYQLLLAILPFPIEPHSYFISHPLD
jgi:hypothetical protein